RARRSEGCTGLDPVARERMDGAAGHRTERRSVYGPGDPGEKRHRMDDADDADGFHEGYMDYISGSETQRPGRHASHLRVVCSASTEHGLQHIDVGGQTAG